MYCTQLIVYNITNDNVRYFWPSDEDIPMDFPAQKGIILDTGNCIDVLTLPVIVNPGFIAGLQNYPVMGNPCRDTTICLIQDNSLKANYNPSGYKFGWCPQGLSGAVHVGYKFILHAIDNTQSSIDYDIYRRHSKFNDATSDYGAITPGSLTYEYDNKIGNIAHGNWATNDIDCTNGCFLKATAINGQPVIRNANQNSPYDIYIAYNQPLKTIVVSTGFDQTQSLADYTYPNLVTKFPVDIPDNNIWDTKTVETDLTIYNNNFIFNKPTNQGVPFKPDNTFLVNFPQEIPVYKQ